MRIAFIAYDWPGYRGGPIVNARRLLPELQGRGHDVHALIFFKGDAPTARYLEQQGVAVHTHAWQSYTEQHIAWILKKIIEIQPDVFVPNLSVAGWFAARWMHEAGIPTIAAHRSDDEYHWAMVEEFVIGHTEWAVTGLVCVSQYLCEQTKAKFPKHTKLCTIPSGVPVPKQIANQRTEGLRLVYVGRLVQQQKRIFDLIEALVEAAQQFSELTATLYGHDVNNEHQQIQQRLQEVNLSQRIRCIGSVEPENLHEQLLKHHVLILLSDYEGTPGAVMDGMACGLVPVCLSIPGGVQELVLHEQTGLLVKDRKDDFLSAISRLYYDVNLREKLGKNAKAHIQNKFSLSVAANCWENFCAELLADAGEKNAIKIPKHYHLPPVRQGLAREDRRCPPFFVRVIRTLHKYGNYLINKWLKPHVW
jgi:glycosyltransferase involved in cell wall biosynthesis